MVTASSIIKKLVVLATLHVFSDVYCNSVSMMRLNFSVMEEVPVTHSIANLIVELRRRNREVSSCTTINEYFQINAAGDLQPARRIDREAICSQQLQSPTGSSNRLYELNPACVVSISVLCPIGDTMLFVKVAVTVLDVNDNAPIWSEPRYEVTLAESAGGSQSPQAVRVPLARDADAGRNAHIQYSISGPDRGAFHLSPRTDAVHLQLRVAVDREVKDSFHVVIEAYDSGSPSLNSSLEVLVSVLDVNDHAPQFFGTPYRTTVSESVGAGTVIFTLAAVDKDIGQNGQITYRFSELVDTATRQLFVIDESNGQVSLAQRLDFETSSVHQLHVVAVDGGSIPQTCETTLTVDVTDVNDNAVAITFTPSNYVAELRQREAADCIREVNLCVEENVKVGTWLATVFAEDRDAGDNDRITCHSESARFSLEPLYPGSTRHFNLSVAQVALDRERNEKYEAIIACSDNGQPPFSSTLTLVVDVTDVNDNEPRFDMSLYNVSVAENNLRRHEIVTLRATDADKHENARITFQLHPNDTNARRLVEVDARGRVLAMTSFDRETMSSFRFRVLAIDSGSPTPLSATATIDVFVTDVNDLPPKFEQNAYTFFVEEHSVACIGNIRAYDEDAESHRYGSVSYRIAAPSPANPVEAQNDFSVDSGGTICTRKQFDRETQSDYHFTVLAIDNPYDISEPQLTSSVSIHVAVTDVNDNPPRFIFPNAKQRAVNVSYYAPVRSRIAQARAVDEDYAENGTITYSLRHLAYETEREPLFSIDKQTGEIVLLRSFQSLHKAGVSGNFLMQKHVLYIFAKDGGNPPRETSQSLDIIVDSSSSGQSQEESENTKSASLLNHPIILISVLILLALVFLILLVVVLSCAFNRNCYSKRTRERRRPKDGVNPDQERHLIQPNIHDHASQLAVHCVNSPLNRSIISQAQNFDAQSDASLPDANEDVNYGMGTILKYDPSKNRVVQQVINMSPSFNTMRRNNIDLLRQCNVIPRSCPTSPPPEPADDTKNNQSQCDSEVRAFTPRATGHHCTSSGMSIERFPHSRAIYQPAKVNMSEGAATRQMQMHTFPRGKTQSASNDNPSNAAFSERSTSRNLAPICDAAEELDISHNLQDQNCVCSLQVDLGGQIHSAECEYHYDNEARENCANRSRESVDWNDTNNNNDEQSSSSSPHDVNNQNGSLLSGTISGLARLSANSQSLVKHLNKKSTLSSITDEISAI